MSGCLQPHGLQHTRPPCPSPTNSWSWLKLTSIKLVMPSNHLIPYHPLLLPSIFPSNRVFSNESVLHIRWPKYWEFQLWHQSFQWIFRPDFFFNFTWRLITLQYCGGFCHIFTWISHGYTCPTSLPIASLRVILVHQPWAPASCIEPGLVIYFTYDNIHVSIKC